MAGKVFQPTIIEYVLPNGKSRTPDGARVTQDTPGVIRRERKSPTWWGRWTDAAGVKHKEPLSPKKDIARKMLDKKAGDAQLGSVGILDQFAEPRSVPLAEHLTDFETYLRNCGDSADYLRRTIGDVGKMLALLTVKNLVDVEKLDPDDVLDVLTAMRLAPVLPAIPPLADDETGYTKKQLAELVGVNPLSLPRMLQRAGLEGQGNGKARRYSLDVVEHLRARHGRGVSTTTTDHYLVALKGFTRWLAGYRKKRRDPHNAMKRIPYDPLGALVRQAGEEDVRVVRRALAATLFEEMLAAAEAGDVFRGLTGPERAMLYVVASRTGFRVSELATLTPRSFDLEADVPTATVKAGYTKDGLNAVQALPKSLVAPLRAFLAGRKPTLTVWPEGWADAAAEVLRHDLDAAGIPFEDADGQVYDFHALRHQFITDLFRAGVNPKDAQTLARHKSIDLTINRYTHVRLSDSAAALDKLPPLRKGQGDDKAPGSSSASA